MPRHWLVKTEPTTFSFADLLAAPRRTTGWDGVRNYTARNTLRDEMKRGDLVLVYHSNAEPPHVAGIAEVAREGYPDRTQFDPGSAHFDPTAKPDAPRWYQVDLRAVRALPRPVTLPQIKAAPALARMALVQKGSRLSVQPVAPREFAEILRLGGLAGAGRR
jgi:predicted RNA-binding protein with PUA-like domain